MPARRGFTLIELLVVISILAILSVIGFVAFGNVQKGARDAKRRADIDAISKALEINKNTNGTYPNIGDCWQGQACWSLSSFGLTNFMQDLPNDPLGSNTGACNNTADTSDACHVYHYCTPDNGTTFVLGVNLETGSARLSGSSPCEAMSGGHLYYLYNQL